MLQDLSMSRIVGDDDFEEIKIPVPWGHMAGKWWGPKGTQPILALHGWQDNAGTFDPLAAALSKYDIPILCVDLPGHGLSSHYPNGMYYQLSWDGIHLIRRIIKYFDWTSKIILMGHSMGASMASLYSSVYRNEVERLIAFDSIVPFRTKSSEISNNFALTIDNFLENETDSECNDLHYEYEDIADMMMEARQQELTQNACATLLKRGIKPYELEEDYFVFTRDVRLKFSNLILITVEQALEFSSMINCDLLIIRAISGQTFDENCEIILNKLKATTNVEESIVPGNHYVHLNNPKLVVQIVLNFLNS